MSYSPTDSLYPRQAVSQDYQRPSYHDEEPYPAQYSAGPSYQPTVLPPSPPVSNFTPSTPSTSSYNSSRSITTVSQTHGAKYVQIHSYGPREGSRGTTVLVRCDVNLPPSPPSSGPPSASSSPNPTSGRKMMRLCFGTTPAATKVIQLSTLSSGEGGYELSATVPALQQSGTIEIKVQVLSETHLVLGETSCGTFDYQHYDYHPSPRVNKRGGEALMSDRPSPSPRLMAHPAPGRRLPPHHSLPGESPEVPPSEEFAHSRGMPSRYRDEDEYGQQAGYRDTGPPPRLGPGPPHHSYASSATATPPSASAHLPSQQSVTPGPSDTPPQPALHRTTQLGMSVGNAPAYNAFVPPQSNKAMLVLQGDLNTMAVGWDQDEWHARRRLVQFWRRQQGSEIHAVFRPIPQEHFQQNSIVISCIYREDKNECFVTSVDAIYLLEALVGVRFTVEEKNRIRRNLEGFRPITVSKTKPGSEAFFKLIMGFPNPKPRNIEKDVKVFPWSIFGPALKKIISKYSASYTGSSPITTHGYPLPEAPAPPYSVPTPLQPPPHHMQPAYSPPHHYDGLPKHESGHYRPEPHYGVAASSHPPHPHGYGYYQQETGSSSYSASQFAGPPPLQTMHNREEPQPVYPVGQ